MTARRYILPVAFAAACVLFAGSLAKGATPAPVNATEAHVVRVLDGDTFEVKSPWAGNANVRITGIDAPELNEAKCGDERTKARAARDMLASLLPAGSAVQLTQVRRDKYFGRWEAVVVTRDGKSVADALLQAGLVQPYQGGKPSSWCAAPAPQPRKKH